MNHSWVKTLAVVLLLLFFAASTGSAYAADLQLYVKEPTAGQASPYPLGKSEPKFGALAFRSNDCPAIATLWWTP